MQVFHIHGFLLRSALHCRFDDEKVPKAFAALMVLGKGKKNCISAPPESHRAPCGNVAAEPSIKCIMPHLLLAVNSELESNTLDGWFGK